MPQELMIQFKDFVEEKRAASLDASMSKCWINPVVTCSTLSHNKPAQEQSHRKEAQLWSILMPITRAELIPSIP